MTERERLRQQLAAEAAARAAQQRESDAARLNWQALTDNWQAVIRPKLHSAVDEVNKDFAAAGSPDRLEVRIGVPSMVGAQILHVDRKQINQRIEIAYMTYSGDGSVVLKAPSKFRYVGHGDMDEVVRIDMRDVSVEILANNIAGVLNRPVRH